MIPESLLRFSNRQGMISPAYLDERDHPWLGVLLSIYRDYVGKPRRLLNERLLMDLPVFSPIGKRKQAILVLDRLTTPKKPSGGISSKLRQMLFREAAQAVGMSANEVKIHVAKQFKMAVHELESALFADLPDERAVSGLEMVLAPSELVLRINLAHIQGYLFRSSTVDMEIFGNTRAIVRQAKLRGLLTTVRGEALESTARLEISGPFTLFRRTLLYGRSLSELVPRLAWCNRFELRATCHLRRGTEQGTLVLKSGDPFLPATQPRQFDSQLEERFTRDFCGLGSDWDLIREPAPIPAEGTLIFPDFLLQHRRDPSRRYWLEILGFWTPEYLSQKLSRLRGAGLSHLILCVDETLNCSEVATVDAEVFYFKRKIDARKVLDLVEGGRKAHTP